MSEQESGKQGGFRQAGPVRSDCLGSWPSGLTSSVQSKGTGQPQADSAPFLPNAWAPSMHTRICHPDPPSYPLEVEAHGAGRHELALKLSLQGGRHKHGVVSGGGAAPACTNHTSNNLLPGG